MLTNMLVVALLIVLNGVFAMSELAVVSSRRARLQAMMRRGRRGARTALELHEQPGRFLSTVQIGITLVGVFAGAFSGATLAQPLADYVVGLGWPASSAHDLALALVVACITYLSLIVGELVPKQIALRNPERVATLMAPPMQMLSRIAKPVVLLLDWSSRIALKLFPNRNAGGARITDEEIHALVAEAASTGVVEPEERSMIAGVMRLADRSIRALMTPRQDLDWIDLDDSIEDQLATLRESHHSKLIVSRGVIDQFVGFLSVKRLVDAQIDGATHIIPASYIDEPLVLPDSLDALDAIPKLKRSGLHSAIVVDEFGSLQGIVTVTDVLAAIAGEFYDDGEPGPATVQRADGSWLVDGDMPAGEMAEALQIELPMERDYETAAGYVLSLLGHLPKTGETLEHDGWLYEVVDMDGRRVDKLLIKRLP
ncbi:hemolysin family protein [Sinimarinibacterium sp. NLF-5-8]|uniref:hemolysin family protein n=1 Tax=Sinimarinibacterium sp. NLF-5-8 TaxID=2698684 RepID=UPI00137C2478|nr:hemolysin family protein [Sinimarinibacterium sp. NLF-5-8]QHS10801.1 HlyC/CorC family transporter [Sinimarinibacterium sp. NLF-5-8]